MFDLIKYRAHLTNAIETIKELIAESKADGDRENAVRLYGKLGGLKLALTYLDEMMKE